MCQETESIGAIFEMAEVIPFFIGKQFFEIKAFTEKNRRLLLRLNGRKEDSPSQEPGNLY